VWAATLAAVHNNAAESIAIASEAFSAGTAQCNTPADTYLQQAQTVLDFVRAGDILQANLSHCIEASFTGDAFGLYQALVRVNPAPYAAYLSGDGFSIASVSPEQFLRLRSSTITAKPIKGTRPRHSDAQQDGIERDTLQTSLKDLAENVMIVDLMRNDLGRVARIGSVKTADLFEIEAHPSVWQMVSTITAELREDADCVALLRACWPPGSMTGAPKIRAMEIIESLEPSRRGVYSGAIGYFDISGACELSVVIRTAVIAKNRVRVQVGGAIVADSDPTSELHETYAKGKKLFETLDWQLK
jgi:para-aminobenzoate synthetase component 1